MLAVPTNEVNLLLPTSPLEESSTSFPLSFKGEGDNIKKRGEAPLKCPQIDTQLYKPIEYELILTTGVNIVSEDYPG